MITIFSCTDRSESNTKIIADIARFEAEKQGLKAQIYSLKELPSNFFSDAGYGEPPESFKEVLNTFIKPVKRFLFIVPEYNGSYPGVLKYFLDTIHPREWEGKKACLIGIATGRAGNLRGLDHLTAVLNYLKMEVYSQKPSLSSIHQFLDNDGKLNNSEYLNLISKQIEVLSQAI